MEMPNPAFDPKLHKLDVLYQFCSGCYQLFPFDQLATHNTTQHALCDGCNKDQRKAKQFYTKGTVSMAVATALCAFALLAIPAHAQNTSTDHVTTCTTDSSDVTTCNTQPNYAEELRRAQSDERARREEDARFWEHIDQQRREGDKWNEAKAKK